MKTQYPIRNTQYAKAQAVLEYVILFAIVLIGLVSAAFMTNAKLVFQGHFDDCVNEITK